MKEAINPSIRFAELEHSHARTAEEECEMGELLRTGKGGIKSLSRAIYHFEKGLSMGVVPWAYYRLGLAYLFSFDLDEGRMEKAKENFRLAAKNGDKMGLLCLKTFNEEEADQEDSDLLLSYYLLEKEKAENGDGRSKYRFYQFLEDAHKEGMNAYIPKEDIDNRFAYLEAAVEEGDHAAIEKAIVLIEKRKLKGGKKRALALINKLIDEDEPSGYYHYGRMLKEETFLKGDPKKAVRNFQKAASYEYLPALKELYLCYKEGFGVEKDRELASFYRARYRRMKKRIDLNLFY